jgi:hypothetical protein
MRATLAAVTLAMFALTGFSPPQRPPQGVQQIVPKSWIPEQAPEQEAPKPPPITLDVTPKSPSAYRHPSALACAVSTGPTKSTREFVESYTKAKSLMDAKRFEDAIAAAEVAASYAHGSKEWLAIEGIRVVAFSALQNTIELVASLEAALATGCMSPGQAGPFREMLDTARQRQAGPRQ